ncbi:MAG: CDP-2,3-bis-(O-geranylgeranyl)-sn-glycerol synthase [Thermoplasmata archaeon]|nr:CDP-2,3-bis-(O-geranylgeranyl)-sn-glycerol synthase [Thermoplasmata archaeon]
MILQEIINALWIMLPAYVANPAAVLFKGKLPIDFNKNFFDGRRILGKGKTWKGFFGGAFSGIVIGEIEQILATIFPNIYFVQFSQSQIQAILIIITISFGSMLGDSFGSFIKRRIKLESGANALFLDQYPFLIISLLLYFIIFSSSFIKYLWNPVSLITLIVITPLLHRLVNIIGFKIGKKEVPW